MTTRLLLVEPSTTMRNVLEKHVETLGHVVESTNDYAHAATMLEGQYRVFGEDFDGIILGWPSVDTADSIVLARHLESSALEDLPVMVMSTDMRADTRAWVASRKNSDLLNWKDYRQMDHCLSSLIDPDTHTSVSTDPEGGNGDISILVVDDSATIRQSLSDLLQLQGFQVGVAGGPEEALEQARTGSFDIAVLDFYLGDTTGDLLCRELNLDPDCGDVVCAVLTGTYADHIIKRSLRAGAVECMFKNESSELLLSRIDAIARFVRQRRALRIERERLSRVIDTVAGSTIVLDQERRIRYLSSDACQTLGVKDSEAMIGRTASSLFGIEDLVAEDVEAKMARWQSPEGTALEVIVRQHLVKETGDLILAFRLAAASMARTNLRPRVDATTDIIHRLGLRDEAAGFLEQFQGYHNNRSDTDPSISLLVVELFFSEGDDVRPLPAPESEPSSRELERKVRLMYRRENHVSCLRSNCYGFLIRHADESKAYLMTRKILQMVNQLPIASPRVRVRSVGSLLSVSNHPMQTVEALLVTATKGLPVALRHGLDHALLIDLKRVLATYPGAVERTP